MRQGWRTAAARTDVCCSTKSDIRRQKECSMAGERRMRQTSCESCAYYMYDEDYEEYICDRNMDEDEYVRLMTDSHYVCPYYRNGDEYAVVRKQM